jgi:hypothetical protein
MIIDNKQIELRDITTIDDYIKIICSNNLKSIQGYNIVNKFPFNDDFSNIYYTYLINYFSLYKEDICNYILKQNHSEQIFESEIVMPDNESYIRYLFPVKNAKELISKNKIPAKKMLTSELYEFSKIADITNKKSNNNSPVVLLEYPYAYPGFFVIDGNHRVYKAICNNIKELEVYLMPSNGLYLLSLSQFFNLLYQVHSNLSEIMLYMRGFISINTLKANYNQISTESFKVT